MLFNEYAYLMVMPRLCSVDLQDRVATAAAPPAAVKAPIAVGGMEDKLICPPPAVAPGIMDPSALR